MKLKLILILLCLPLLVGFTCSKQAADIVSEKPLKSFDKAPENFLYENVTSFEDPKYGVVCYVYNNYNHKSLSCVKVR